MMVTDVPSLQWHTQESVTTVLLSREKQRNALNEATVQALHALAVSPPEGTKVFIIAGHGSHFCSGLDLAEHVALKRGPQEFWQVCRLWHAAFDAL
jgi:(methylthio)acryloyl-CoA hydratase